MLSSAVMVVTAKAQILYWDTDGATAGSSGANGTWGTSTFWSTSAAGTAATTGFTSGRDTVFSAGTNATGSYTVTVSGTQNVSSINIEEGAPTFTGGTINFNDATPDFTVNISLTATVNSTVSGSNGLTKLGAGTLLLAGANTYTGATAVNAGTLQLQGADALGTAANSSNTTVAAGSVLQLANNITTSNSGTLVLNGTGTGSGALQNLSGNNTWNSNVSLAGNATIFSSTAGQTLTIGNTSATNLFTMGANTVTFDGPGDSWINSDVGVSGDTGGLIKNGTGKLTLYGYNTYYTGATVVNAGSLDLVVGPFYNAVRGINGALTIGTGAGAAGSVSVNILSVSFADQLSASSNVTINSDGVLSVGNSTSLGSLTLNGGKVDILYPNRPISPTGNITSNATSAHQTALISGGPISLSGTTLFTVGRDALLTSDLTVSSEIDGGALTKEGLGVLTLSGANTSTGATTVNAGTLLLGASNVIADGSALVINGGTFDLGWGHSETVASLAGTGGTLDIKSGPFTLGDATNTTFSGVIADSGGSGTLVKQGTGTLTLSGTNTYSGVTTINAGAIVAASSTALGTSTSGNTIASGAALHLQGGIALTEGSFTVTGTGVGATGAIRNLGGNNTLNAALNLGGSTTVTADAGTLSVSGPINLGSGNILTVAGAGNTTLSGSLNGSSALTKTGAGTLTFSGTVANSFGGALNINDGTVLLNKTPGTNAISGSAINVGDGSGAASSAVLRLGASNQIADYTGVMTIASDGLFDLNNQTEAIDRLAGNGRIDLGSSGKLTVGVNSGNSTFGGSFLGTGTLIKAGAGSLTLQASLVITGEFQLNSGTIFLSGYNLTAGTLHITGNSTIDFAGGNSTLNASIFIIDAGVTLTIANWTNAADFFFAQNWSGAAFNVSGAAPENQVSFAGFSISDTKWQSYDSQITPVPEPATYGAWLVGLMLGLCCWRRYRARASPV